MDETNENSELPINIDKLVWAHPVSQLKVDSMPPEAVNLNVDGRGVVGPLQGFGQLWRKTYRYYLTGVEVAPQEVMRVWKENFNRFLPKNNRFFTSVRGMEAGEVLLINASMKGLPVKTGMLVLYSDEETLTLMTPEGHPESGWNTFSAYLDNGCTVVQVESMARANDPIFEFGYRYLGGASEQERIWPYVLTKLGEEFGVKGTVEFDKDCLDPNLQWSEWRNIRYNSTVRSMLHSAGTPLRIVGKLIRK